MRGSFTPRRAALILCAAAAAGCAGMPPGSKIALTRFPIGIYNADDPQYLARLKDDGFDSILPYTDDPARLASLAREAKRLGMRMVVSPDRLRDAPSSLTRDWPVDAWYLLDEPELKISSSALQELADKAHAWDPERLQAFVIGEGSPAKVYGGIGDIMMLDWYPVPHKPTDSVADQIDLVMRAIPAGKPFWMVIQAYDWTDGGINPAKPKRDYRFPTRAEIRFMSYLSVLHGARGLYYFRLKKKDKTLFDYPELWAAVSGVAREIREIRPIFERGERVPLPFAVPGGGLEAGAWRYRYREYAVLVNRRAAADQSVPAEFLDGSWRALFSAERDPKAALRSVGGGYSLPAQGVLVLESARQRGMPRI